VSLTNVSRVLAGRLVEATGRGLPSGPCCARASTSSTLGAWASQEIHENPRICDSGPGSPSSVRLELAAMNPGQPVTGDASSRDAAETGSPVPSPWLVTR
jgi:hypothetical protein